MVRIDNDYVILVDEMSYTAAIDRHSVNKLGKPVYDTIGYFGSLKQALEGVYRHKLRKSLMVSEKPLRTAIEEVDRLAKEMHESLKRAEMEIE